MVTTVKLQPPFEYSRWVLLISAFALALAVTLLIFSLVKINAMREKRVKKPQVYRPPVMTPQMLLRIKGQYVERVQAICDKYGRQVITKRDGYQELSAVIRGFVHEATGINVENLTKAEVKALGIRKLDQLMEEYYVPEFAEDEKAREKDLLLSCNTAMGVIKAWS